mgnify:CR=1 FL=1
MLVIKIESRRKPPGNTSEHPQSPNRPLWGGPIANQEKHSFFSRKISDVEITTLLVESGWRDIRSARGGTGEEAGAHGREAGGVRVQKH